MGMTLSVQCNYDLLVCVRYGSPTSILGWDMERIKQLENSTTTVRLLLICC